MGYSHEGLVKMHKNHWLEVELQQLIDRVLLHRKVWEQRRSQTERQIRILDAKLAAYQLTLKDYWQSTNGLDSLLLDTGDESDTQN